MGQLRTVSTTIMKVTEISLQVLREADGRLFWLREYVLE